MEELGLFASRALEVGKILEGPVFVLVQTEDDQEGLNALMQFEDRNQTWVGCGPARLVNVSKLFIPADKEHSCRPNVRWLKKSYGRRDARRVQGCLSVVLEVILPIEQGEQLYASYGEAYCKSTRTSQADSSRKGVCEMVCPYSLLCMS